MMILTFYVPEQNCEEVKKALFNVGAGKIGNYDCCSFETRGIGQFRALEGANPSLGKIGEIEKIIEMKVEIAFDDIILDNVVRTLKAVHPYETVAFNVVKSIVD